MSDDFEYDTQVNYAKMVVEQNNEIQKLRKTVSDLRNQIEVQKKMSIPITVATQVAEQKEEIEKLRREVEWLTKKVPVHILINRKENKSTRKGGLKK